MYGTHDGGYLVPSAFGTRKHNSSFPKGLRSIFNKNVPFNTHYSVGTYFHPFFSLKRKTRTDLT